MAIGAALVWLAVFVLLGVTELLCLVWLADGGPPAWLFRLGKAD